MRRYPLVLVMLFARLAGRKLLVNLLVVMNNVCILVLGLYMFRPTGQILSNGIDHNRREGHCENMKKTERAVKFEKVAVIL